MTMLERRLAVNEFFGPTLQGEGPFAGQPAYFLRLGGCNLACIWCDTPYTWDSSRYDLRKEITNYTVDEVRQMLADSRVTRLVISGGEPLLQQDAIIELLATSHSTHVEIETNGTVMPADALRDVVHFNVSPKLSHARNHPLPLDFGVLKAFTDHLAIFKFVVQEPRDVIEVGVIVDAAEIHHSRVWLMPEGITAEQQTDRLGWVCDAAAERGWNVTTRLHVLAWGDVRGR